MALNNIDPRGLKQARINGVESRDLLGLVVSERVPIKSDALGLPAKTRRFAPGGCVLAGIDVQFFWYAPHVDASTSQRGLFYNGYSCTKFRAFARSANSARACAYDHQVVIKMLSHRFTKSGAELVVFRNFIVVALRLQSSVIRPKNG